MFTSRFHRYRGGVAAAVLACLAILSLGGCGDDSSTNPPPPFDAPTNLRVINGNETITVRWDASPNEGDTDFKRYNIYRGTSSLQDVPSADLEQLGYKIGTATAADRSFASTVANGTLYYFQVRGEKNDGTLSDASNEAQGAGRLEGEGKIIVEFAANGNSGFDFSEGNAVSLNENNPDRFVLTDIYLGTDDPNDLSTFELSLKSPSLLSNRNSGWNGKVAAVKFLGTDWNASTTTTFTDTQINVLPNAIYAIKTPSNNYVKLQVTAVDGEAGSRSITFKYAYQPTPNLIQF